MPALSEPIERTEGDNFRPAECPLCESNSFAFWPEIGYLVCWGCQTGFRPHEYAVMKATAQKVN